MPGLASESPEVQAMVNRVVSKMPGAVPAQSSAPVAPVVTNTPPANPVLGWFGQYGIKAENEQVLGEAFGGIVSQAQQWDAFERLHGNQYRQWLQAQQQGPPPQQFQPPPVAPAQPAPVKDYWEEAWPVQPLDPQIQALVQKGVIARDENTGLYAVAPQYAAMYNPSLAAQVNQWAADTERVAQQYKQNPVKYTWDKVAPKIEEQFEQWYAKREQQYMQQREMQAREQQILAYEQQNAQWMYQRDPVTGQQAFTPEGHFVAQRASELVRQGFRDPQQALAYAQRDLRDIIAQQQAQVAPPQALPPAPVAPPPQPFLVNAAKQQQALHNPSHVPQPQVNAVTPPKMTWGDLGTHVRSLMKPSLPAA